MTMIGRWSVAAVLLVILGAETAQGQVWRFHWQSGQVLNYRVEQSTAIAEVVDGQPTETRSKLQNTKRWQVLDVDPAGTATLQLSLTSLRLEMTTPSGEVMVYDSANPEGNNPALKTQMEKYIGQPLALLRVDNRGQVVDVKESKFGPASRYESEPPFVITLPATAGAPNWERAYKVTLEPPQGTGDKYEAVQTYTRGNVEGRENTVTLATILKTQPEAAADQIPLFQMQPAGEIDFDNRAGLMQSASLHIDKQIKNHQGEGSSYHFQSTYTERYVGGK
jgi:hypothetical protein